MNERPLIGLFLLSIGILTTIDILEDFFDGTSLRHLGLDIGIATISFLAVSFLLYKFVKSRQKIKALELEKNMLKEIAEKYKLKSKMFIEGLSIHIDREFEQWKLSISEREIALFLLKGLGPSEIADIRSTSEKTVRHQMASVYRKANLKGRQELLTYFLEDLLAPPQQQGGKSI